MKYARLGTMLIAALASAAFSPAQAATGNASTQPGTANATVIAPLVLSHTGTAALNFGKFTSGTGGTVVVTAAGVASATSGVVIMTNSTSAADAFTVAGDNSRSFTVASGGGTLTSGGSTMSFTTAPSAATVTTSSTGAAAFTVGGTLTVPSGAATGTYSGTYSVTVTYN